MTNKDKIINSIKACSSRDKKCGECICNSWMRDTCQEILFKKTLKLIEHLEREDLSVREQVLKMCDEIKDILEE